MGKKYYRKKYNTKNMKALNSQQKEKILQESYEEGCVITELGRKYGVSEKTIHGWRKKDKERVKNNEAKSSANFIEVHVEETVVRAKLKKVELVYEKFKIEVSGEISSEKIAPIMQILEG
jgi:transposase-like protein